MIISLVNILKYSIELYVLSELRDVPCWAGVKLVCFLLVGLVCCQLHFYCSWDFERLLNLND